MLSALTKLPLPLPPLHHALLGLLVAAGDIAYWHVLVTVFIAGTFWATEFPVRRALMADLVPHEAIGRAVSVDWTTDSFNRMVGPALGGGLLVIVLALFFAKKKAVTDKEAW